MDGREIEHQKDREKPRPMNWDWRMSTDSSTKSLKIAEAILSAPARIPIHPDEIASFNRHLARKEHFNFQNQLTAMTEQPELSANAPWEPEEEPMQPTTKTLSTNLVMSASLIEESELNKKLGLDANQKFLAESVLEENLKNFAETNNFKFVTADQLHKNHGYGNYKWHNALIVLRTILIFGSIAALPTCYVLQKGHSPESNVIAGLLGVLGCLWFVGLNVFGAKSPFLNKHILANIMVIKGAFAFPKTIPYKIPMRVKQRMSELLDSNTFEKFTFHYHELVGEKNWIPNEISLIGIKSFQGEEFLFLVESFKPEA